MVNPRLIRYAKKHGSKEVPDDRVVEPEREEGVIHILERDEDGKPILELTPIEGTAIHTPTRGGYNELMMVYECGGWKWGKGDMPTVSDNWKVYSEETCIRMDKFLYHGSWGLYQGTGYNIISADEFYERQKVTPEMREEINKWFNENGK